VRPVVISGAASGMGAALYRRLRNARRATLGIDRHRSDVTVDLAEPAGRRQAAAEIAARAPEGIAGLATFAGVSGHSGVPGSTVVSVDYFGTVDLITACRPLLSRGGGAGAIAISSIGAVVHPDVPHDLVRACLDNDEQRARALADETDPSTAYVAAKLAVGRWVRRNAPKEAWVGAGIRLNVIMPGLVLTPLVTEAERSRSGRAQLERFKVPAGRAGTADEVASLAQFMLGSQGRYLIGSVVTIDGGSEAAAVPDAWPAPRS
jgi:NAD(P)-dependent dehydrogenase (short-subunit alcohol dehydrogenase family)